VGRCVPELVLGNERTGGERGSVGSLHTRGLESLVTVTFQQEGEDTRLTLCDENLPDDEYGRGHEKGWDYLLSRFADRFPRGRDER
jgi:hypothetical protein